MSGNKKIKCNNAKHKDNFEKIVKEPKEIHFNMTFPVSRPDLKKAEQIL